MNVISLNRLKEALRFAIVSAAATLAAYGQTTQINLATQGRNVDFTGAPSTKPIKTGTALPATCLVGELFFKTNAVAGQNLYGCTSANIWTLFNPAPVATPVGAIVGTTDTQTLTNKSIDASEINSGTLSPSLLPAANTTPGTFGDATHTPQLTVDGTGRVTAISQLPAALTGGLGDPGSNGVVVRTGVDTTSSVAAPNGGIVGTTDTQTLTNKSIDASEITSGTLSSSTFPAVNTTPGVFGDATHSAQVTVDVKGRVTAVSQFPLTAGAGLGDPGSNGVVVRTAANTTSSVAAPTGALVGTSDTQTLTNKSIDASEINSGTLAAARVAVLNQSTTGNAATATALSALPVLCPTGQAPTGVLANGNATGCAAISGGSGGAATPATTNVLVGTGVANGVAAGVPNVNYLAPANPAMTGAPTVNGNKIGIFRVAALPDSCVVGTDSSVLFASGGTDAVYACDNTGHYSIPPGGSTTVLGGDVTGLGSANTVSKIGGNPVGTLATQNAPAAGLVTSDGTNLGSRTAPVGAIVGVTDAQTLTNKSIDASEINSGILTASRIPAFSGDIATVAGSTATALAAVNTTPGTFGDATHSAQVTVDAKGRITSVSQSPLTASAGLGDPGSNGVVVRTAANTTSSVAAPTGALVGTSDTQTLTNKSIDASEIASGTLTASRLPAFSGDISTAIGSTAATLPTVNTTPGTFGDATHSAQVTVDAKGRITAVSQLPVTATAGLGDPGFNGVVVRTAADVTTSVAAPAGAIVGTSDTQTLTNKSIDASEINSGTLAAARVAVLNQSTTGNAATATALSALPVLCPTGQAPTGVLANGNATGCAAISGGSGGAATPATTNVLVGTGVANGVAAGVPNVNYLAPANPAMTGAPTVNGNKIGIFRVAALPTSCVVGTDSSVLFASGGTDAVYACDNTGHYSMPPGGSTTVLGGDVTGLGSANTVSKIGGNPVGTLATQNAPVAGLVTSDGTNLASRTAPVGAIVGVTDAQTLTNKSIDASEINSGILTASRIPAFSGDIATVAGSTAAALAAVNTTPGTFGDATHSAQVTVDAKGRITAVSQQSVAPTGLADPGANGMVVRTAVNVTSVVTPPSGAIVGTSDVQTLTSKSIDGSEINSGTIAAVRIPVLNQNTTGNAGTATALAAAPTQCTGQFTTGVAASGNANCAAVATVLGYTPQNAAAANANNDALGAAAASQATAEAFSANASNISSGTIAAARVPVLNQNTTGNASTATALAATPTVCATGQAPTGILANGNATGCAVSTGSGLQAPPATGIITGTIGSTVTGSIPAPTGAVVGTTDTQVLSNKDLTAVTNTFPSFPLSQITGTGNLAAQSAPTAGVVTSTGTSLSSVAAPAGVLVGTTATQTLTAKSIDASEINSGTLSASRFPAFSGDIVTAAGSTAATLPTVNTTPGTFGDATHAAQVTVDAKGRITAVSQLALAASSGLADPGSNGLVLRTAANVTSSVAAPTGVIVGTSDTQTLTGKSIDASEVNSGILSGSRLPAFSGDIVTAAGSTAATLPTVNASPGTFGDSTHTAQLTVDGKGRVTGLTLLAITGGGGGGSITSGALSTLPVSCSAGTLYFVTDQTPGQQLYTCSSANTWTQLVNLGGSGALLFSGGSLDINPAVVPRLAAANTFTGPTTATSGLSLLTANPQPACSSSSRGTFWYLNNGSAKDNVQVCVYTGSAFAWISLY